MLLHIVSTMLCLLCGMISGQLVARPPRSLYGGWSPIGGIGPAGGISPASGISPAGLGHMTKDELLTLLDAWREVEADERPEAMEAAAPPPPPPPPPPARPAPPPAAAAELPQRPSPGTPLTVRLPAFVPIQLSAMYVSPAEAGGATIGGSGGGIDEAIALSAPQSHEAAPRLFRFMHLPMQPQQQQQQQQHLMHQFVVRNTLDSVDAGTAPTASRVKPKLKSNGVDSAPLPAHIHAHAPAPASRPRFVAPPAPFLGHVPGPLELVPSSQLFSNWH